LSYFEAGIFSIPGLTEQHFSARDYNLKGIIHPRGLSDRRGLTQSLSGMNPSLERIHLNRTWPHRETFRERLVHQGEVLGSSTMAPPSGHQPECAGEKGMPERTPWSVGSEWTAKIRCDIPLHHLGYGALDHDRAVQRAYRIIMRPEVTWTIGQRSDG
jgi:hypothetical protein